MDGPQRLTVMPSTSIPPTATETASRALANHLIYAMESVNQHVPDFAHDAARSPYGDTDNDEHMTMMLVEICVNLKDSERSFVLHNGRNPKSRALNVWWTEYQKRDI